MRKRLGKESKGIIFLLKYIKLHFLYFYNFHNTYLLIKVQIVCDWLVYNFHNTYLLIKVQIVCDWLVYLLSILFIYSTVSPAKCIQQVCHVEVLLNFLFYLFFSCSGLLFFNFFLFSSYNFFNVFFFLLRFFYMFCFYFFFLCFLFFYGFSL